MTYPTTPTGQSLADGERDGLAAMIAQIEHEARTAQLTEDDLLDFLEWMDGRGLAVTEPESHLRYGIAEWIARRREAGA